MNDRSPVLAHLGKQIAAWRRVRKMTQEQFAEKLDVSPGYVRRFETGRENLSIGSIGKLARALDVTIWDLLKPPHI